MNSEDLGPGPLAAVLGSLRPVRTYPALLSTEAAAMAWAHQGAPGGAVVVAGYQAAPRGRGGLPWRAEAGRGLGFTLLARPSLPPEREGWPYVVGLVGLHDVVGTEDSRLDWPDTVVAADGTLLARLGVQVELGPGRIEWLGLTVLVDAVQPPRAPLLARLVAALERRLGEPPESVLADYLPRCATLGRTLRALLIPVGPGGPEVTGQAVDVDSDGALVMRTEQGRRVAVPPHGFAWFEAPDRPVEPPRLLGRRVREDSIEKS